MHNNNYPLTLLLATESTYKKAVLEKLGISFISKSPSIDESPLPNESPRELVTRLSVEKANKIQQEQNTVLTDSHSFVIAADQVACFEDQILGKPGTKEKAVEQLLKCSGKQVTFLTGLALSKVGESAFTCVEEYVVTFKHLTENQIIKYVESENPVDCAGSFKCEGKGVLLFKSMQGRDINSLVGLPLIALAELFERYNVDLFDYLPRTFALE